jgi:hypothetical protein
MDCLISPDQQFVVAVFIHSTVTVSLMKGILIHAECHLLVKSEMVTCVYNDRLDEYASGRPPSSTVFHAMTSLLWNPIISGSSRT